MHIGFIGLGIMGKPMATLNRCIHGPGFGRNFNQSGRQLRTR